MTTPAEQRNTDRHHAVRYSEAALLLRLKARELEARITEVATDERLHTFARTIALHERAVLDVEVAYYDTAASQAEELAAQYREHLGVGA